MVLQFLFGESKNVKQARSDQNAQEAKLKALQLETAEKKEKVAASLKERQRIGEIADQAHSTTAKLDCDYGELHGDMEKVRKSIEACKKDILQLTEAIDANRVASVTVRDRCTTMQEQLEIMRTIRVWTAGDASAAPSCVKATQPVSLVAADPSKSEPFTLETRLAMAVTAGLLGDVLSQNLDDSCGGTLAESSTLETRWAMAVTTELLEEAVSQNLDDSCGGDLDVPHGSKVAVAEICATLYGRSVVQEADFAIVDEVANEIAQSVCVAFDDNIDDEADNDPLLDSGVMSVTSTPRHSDL
eukprot:gnl/TRDRNA2_/TRDRNA2_163523_c1_seq2.p1 gnl/TRDRNA2_/TRDRNA2_163523_c1~~gnl/TRDRNA2_/TRDRNA2_163523_c1_seq2.p1  ORF type:complete len:301 (+),score=70.60 gnl/TRDRNA2_/TRDRNA2_163523_c1_seq2:103-1005(+)